MSEEEQLVGTLVKIESHRQIKFIPNEYSRHVIDSEGLPVYAEPQPQLTILKSIADELDKYYKIGFEEIGEADHWLQEHGITKWMCGPDYIKNSALFDIYLAGKALGVDLVKVVEG